LGVYRPLEGRDICGAKIAARMQGRIVRRPMVQQEAMIERTRRVCREDERLAAAMIYGSFAQGEGDGFSDIEFILFFRDEDLEVLDQEEWGRELMAFPAERHGVAPPTAVLVRLDRRCAETFSAPGPEDS
jgi:predicted nucleotidyltransferase